MKKRKMVLIAIIAVLAIIVINLWDEMIITGKIMINCLEDYDDKFSYQDIFVDDKEKEISIDFMLKGNDFANTCETISFLYNEIYDIIYVEKTHFKAYKVSLTFQTDEPGGEHVSYFDITEEKNDIHMVIKMYDDIFSITEVTQMCPEVSSLLIGNLEYDTLEDFSAFTNLEYVWFMGVETNEEVENYILSKFPNCKISWKEE